MAIDTINGAKSSAILYSIAETAKANQLKPYNYFKYLLEEIPKHMDDTDRRFLNSLLPWSPDLPAEIRKTESVSKNRFRNGLTVLTIYRLPQIVECCVIIKIEKLIKKLTEAVQGLSQSYKNVLLNIPL